MGRSLSSKLRRAISKQSGQTRIAGAAATSQDTSAEESGNEPAKLQSTHLELDDLDTPPPAPSSPSPPPRKSLRRRVSISLSPSYLRKAITPAASQDRRRSITKRSDESQHPGDNQSTGASGPASLPSEIHSKPPEVRAANKFSPTTVREAMRSAMARDSSGGNSGSKLCKPEGTIGGKLHCEPGDQPVVSNKVAVSSPAPASPPPLASQEKRQRRRRSLGRSASFTAGSLWSAAIIAETPGEGKVGGRARDQLADFSGEPLNGGRRAGGGHRHVRGRSMSLVVMGRGSSANVGRSAPPSPSCMRGDDSGNRSVDSRSAGLAGGGSDFGGGGGGGNGGFRHRLRQRAGAGSGFPRGGRTRSVSPPGGNRSFLGGHASTISMSADLLTLDSSGSWAGPSSRGFAGVDGGERHKRRGLLSILDAVPPWERPKMLKGLQGRCVSLVPASDGEYHHLPAVLRSESAQTRLDTQLYSATKLRRSIETGHKASRIATAGPRLHYLSVDILYATAVAATIFWNDDAPVSIHITTTSSHNINCLGEPSTHTCPPDGETALFVFHPLAGVNSWAT